MRSIRTFDPARQPVLDLRARTKPRIQQQDRGVVVLVPDGPADRLVQRLQAQPLVVPLPGPRAVFRVEVAHLLAQLGGLGVGVGEADDGDAAAQVVAKVDPFAHLAANHCEEQRSALLDGGGVGRKDLVDF